MSNGAVAALAVLDFAEVAVEVMDREEAAAVWLGLTFTSVGLYVMQDICAGFCSGLVSASMSSYSWGSNISVEVGG